MDNNPRTVTCFGPTDFSCVACGEDFFASVDYEPAEPSVGIRCDGYVLAHSDLPETSDGLHCPCGAVIDPTDISVAAMDYALADDWYDGEEDRG
ncbi:MAG: hypothetical protein AB7I42_22825 [Bradyrhizobium sp.]|uniref:hypothetical protein n=1 Tax=Bradyrhizobium sp. TaxID=376 RepID=UPI003D0C24C9